jgi:catechol 2,3-dioxygenase-like lactoylglutathione lyase family enzyme
VNLQFDCVFYYVSDLEAAVRFYTGVLDLKLASKDAVARFDLGGALFELVLGKVGGKGNAPLCLRVEDIEVARSELAGRGFRCPLPRTRETGKWRFSGTLTEMRSRCGSTPRSSGNCCR